MGHEIRRGAHDRRPVVAVAEGDWCGQRNAFGGGDLGILRARDEGHIRRLQIDRGEHQRDLAARRRDDKVELLGRPRAARPEPAFLRGEAHTDTDRDSDQRDENGIRGGKPAKYRADQRPG